MEIEEAIAEIKRLRAIGLYLVQHENGGHCVRQNGIPCRETNKCGCYLEFENLKIDHQQNAEPVNKPFERVPQHESDPGFGPVPPRRVVNKKDSETPDC